MRLQSKMSDSEGKVLWQEIEQLLPWEIWHPFLLSRSIWSCCWLLVCLMLFSKVHSSYLSGLGNTLVKNPAVSLNLPFHTFAESFLITACTSFHCRHVTPTPVTILSTVFEETHCLVLPLVAVLGTLFLTARGPLAQSRAIVKICPKVSSFLRGRGNLPIKWKQTPICCNFRMKRQTVSSPLLMFLEIPLMVFISI